MNTEKGPGTIFLLCVDLILITLIIVGSYYEHERMKDLASAGQKRHAVQERVENERIAARIKKWESKENLWSAAQISTAWVKDRLKTPASAKFQEPWDATVAHLGDGIYAVSAYVDSKNSFGAMTRTRYHCKLQDTGEDDWHLIELQIGSEGNH